MGPCCSSRKNVAEKKGGSVPEEIYHLSASILAQRKHSNSATRRLQQQQQQQEQERQQQEAKENHEALSEYEEREEQPHNEGASSQLSNNTRESTHKWNIVYLPNSGETLEGDQTAPQVSSGQVLKETNHTKDEKAEIERDYSDAEMQYSPAGSLDNSAEGEFLHERVFESKVGPLMNDKPPQRGNSSDSDSQSERMHNKNIDKNHFTHVDEKFYADGASQAERGSSSLKPLTAETTSVWSTSDHYESAFAQQSMQTENGNTIAANALQETTIAGPPIAVRQADKERVEHADNYLVSAQERGGRGKGLGDSGVFENVIRHTDAELSLSNTSVEKGIQGSTGGVVKNKSSDTLKALDSVLSITATREDVSVFDVHFESNDSEEDKNARKVSTSFPPIRSSSFNTPLQRLSEDDEEEPVNKANGNSSRVPLKPQLVTWESDDEPDLNATGDSKVEHNGNDKSNHDADDEEKEEGTRHPDISPASAGSPVNAISDSAFASAAPAAPATATATGRPAASVFASAGTADSAAFASAISPDSATGSGPAGPAAATATASATAGAGPDSAGSAFDFAISAVSAAGPGPATAGAGSGSAGSGSAGSGFGAGSAGSGSGDFAFAFPTHRDPMAEVEAFLAAPSAAASALRVAPGEVRYGGRGEMTDAAEAAHAQEGREKKISEAWVEREQNAEGGSSSVIISPSPVTPVR